ncbi:folylpolyglutamate synthase/dihydrofolate synthase family protein [Glycocaulis abyssi]|uniref:Dihydrofolate synthase/folylpolyglutamate synthase n=1 Tax=Glycocaulis abyssi TaxID=1433403 RepID=A0ABV9NFY3_9PROT
MSIPDALARLANLHPASMDLSLDRLTRLLETLGKPQDRLPSTIHIAGTNGKGSSAAFLKAICEAAGERVHVYTSPHLVRFNERIVLAGAEVEDAPLLAALERVEAANAGQPLTFFEATTAAAFLLFSETPADRLILEVGLGGRLDATNVITSPAITLITPVSLDHQAYLGDTLEKIAAEKAGILKRGVPCVVGPQADEALMAIERAALRLSAPLTLHERDYHAYVEHDRLVYEEENLVWDLPLPGLFGSHQISNAAGAIAVARRLDLSEEAVRDGLPKARWRARMQRLTSGPLADIARAGEAELWLDGGHNPAAGEVLAQAMGELESREERPLVLICGFSAGRDAEAFLKPFAGLAGLVITVSGFAAREGAMSAQDAAEAARKAGHLVQTSAGLIEALTDACHLVERPRVVICGSLYLAGHALSLGGDAPLVTPG